MRMPWPRSLLMRNSLLLVALVFITDIASVAVFIHVVQKPRIESAATFIANQVATINSILTQLPAGSRQNYIQQINGQQTPPAEHPHRRHILPGKSDLGLFLDQLKAALPPGMTVRWQGRPDPILWFKLNMDGQPYWISMPIANTMHNEGLWSSVILSLILSFVALAVVYAIHRRVNRPLSTLAATAKQVGLGDWPAPLPLEGPSEIRSVSESFNHMIDRLADLEAKRATVLAGISHDIRTPLTKLRLTLAMSPLPAQQTQQDLNRYFNDIDRILQQFIDFARGSADETMQTGQLNDLITALAADFAGLGHEFTLELSPLPKMMYRPIAMMRLLMNLMDNAVKYGKQELEVASWQEAAWVHIAIRDRGVALQTENFSNLKLPFQRGSHHSTPGSGLGLAIAEQIARQHHGSLTLTPRDGGGMEAHLSIPVTQPA